MNGQYKYDVAISFAEEDRLIALNIARALELQGLKTYYYPDNIPDDLGQDITERLTKIYAEESASAVVIFSENYFKEERTYTRIELEAIKKRMKEETDIVYMIPVKPDKNFVVAEERELSQLIFVEWNYNDKEIAAALARLLGKELVSIDDNAGAGSVIYNNGNGAAVISGVTAGDIKQNVFNTSGDANIINIQGFPDAKDERRLCCICYFDLGVSVVGKVICPKCKKINYIRTDIRTLAYSTLYDDKEHKEYDKIRAHINNKIRDGKYDEAYKYCLEAEKIAPGEYYTWEHFAKTEFLIEINRWPITIRSSSSEIIKMIKTHIDKCKDFGMEAEAYDELVIDIANRLFKIERNRLLSVMGLYNENLSMDKWRRENIRDVMRHLKSFEDCYRLCKDPTFLKEYVNILAKPYRWLVRKEDTGELIRTCKAGTINPVEKFNALVEKIKRDNPDYIPPVIPAERFVIKKVTTLKMGVLTVKTI